MRRIVRKIFAAVLIAGLVIAWVSGPVLADRVIRPENENGLEIHLPEKTVDTGNLNPGDTKESYLRLVNEGSYTLTVSIRTNITSEKTPFGGGPWLSDDPDVRMTTGSCQWYLPGSGNWETLPWGDGSR